MTAAPTLAVKCVGVEIGVLLAVLTQIAIFAFIWCIT